MSHLERKVEVNSSKCRCTATPSLYASNARIVLLGVGVKYLQAVKTAQLRTCGVEVMEVDSVMEVAVTIDWRTSV